MSKQPEYGPWIAVNPGEVPQLGEAETLQVQWNFSSRICAEKSPTWTVAEMETSDWESFTAYRVVREPVKETQEHSYWVKSYPSKPFVGMDSLGLISGCKHFKVRFKYEDGEIVSFNGLPVSESDT